MTWRELQRFIAQLDESYLNDDVRIIDFNLGCIDDLSGISQIGLQRDVESHIESIETFDPGTPYLLYGYSS